MTNIESDYDLDRVESYTPELRALDRIQRAGARIANRTLHGALFTHRIMKEGVLVEATRIVGKRVIEDRKLIHWLELGEAKLDLLLEAEKELLAKVQSVEVAHG